jgi:FkbM family methyltransferase
MIGANRDPRLARALAETRAFRSEPVIAVDAGAWGGPSTTWRALEPDLQVIGFDPDEDEVARLQRCADDEGAPHVYFPLALGRKTEERRLRLARFVPASSMVGSMTLFDRHTNAPELVVTGERSVTVRAYDAVSVEHALPRADLFKVDVQGAELEVLEGAAEALTEALAVEVEIWFHARPPGVSVFADVDTFLRQKGFVLFDLDAFRFARQALPFPMLYDFRDAEGRAMPGPTVRGQVMTGDALYMRDPLLAEGRPDDLSSARLLKLIALLDCYGLTDCAADLLLEFRDRLVSPLAVDELLDLLVPPDSGVQSYEAYLDRAHAFTADEQRVFGPSPDQLRELWETRSGV